MFIKAYSKSIHLEAMEMLLKRLSLDHPKYLTVTNHIGTTRAGDIGEEIVF
ncbi:hypothetical protein [Psychrobacillus lasiicapitis]|uniref:hypothetical protein n=1 Tax=Psychrobacillus lasiicapitis TaxID=1636719 RepID=UPI0014774DE1|nr:hypothetical protein [Psychrobacillus lasiicapitis]GGA42448.1 hypothetical protein GCM10011384_35220 [Psychrobacillus lasiicapitis]